MKKLFLGLLFVALSASAQKQQTLTYFANDTLKLELDLFLPEKMPKEPIPLIIHVHGGGFSGGERQSGYDFCKYLAQNGYAAATISYTLYMKNKKFSCDGQLTEKVKAFQFGANDIWLATSYFLKNKDKFGIDASKIFVSGISAGAEALLHAAYWDRKSMSLYPNNLPDTFKYAGLISGAGAIMDLNLITQDNLVPMLLYHGNGDKTVPYATAAHHYCPPGSSGWLMLFGSYSIFGRIGELEGSGALYTYCGGGHEYSGFVIEKEPQRILAFMNKVLSGERLMTHDIIQTGKSNELSSAYDFCH
ncbi:alpha/beta hydrolase [Flavobacterium silvaticum]|uniref:Alpha/beta hydrolase n=1 Tax=Flavobacterium silvaticum TaxID=1852020 RepID=A0A972JFX9_9FLAO|nr:alpha/beta hydrolase [Flavobacterium silvaticum]NMH27626.1 alpha/beta hydrolase [Flavobacterium silvaticum]